jgi:Caspase domain
MKTALAEFCNTLSETDAAIVYYSGHGYQFNEQSRLVPADYDPTKVKYEFEVQDKTLSLDDVLNALSATKARPKIVILDACRNLLAIVPITAHGRGQVGLADVRTPDDETLVCYSTKADAAAVDDSTYGPILAEEIVKPGKTIDAVMREVTRRVKNATNGRQLPWTYGNLTEDFYLNAGSIESPTPKPIVAVRPSPTPPPPPAPALPNLQDFVRASWRHYTSNDPTVWAADFAPSVNYCYYHKGAAADRSYVEPDRAKLLASYPIRHYDFSGLTTQMEPDVDSARAHYTYNYAYNGRKMPPARHEYLLRFHS